MGRAILGREAELEAVERFLDGIAAGPSALVVEGEAGIGKTTVWLEAVRAAEARSFRLLQARPAESEARLSYAALADLVGTAFEETRAMLPAPQEHALATALLRVETDEPADPRTTATALVGVLSALTADGPVLVAVDDVQWLDPASERQGRTHRSSCRSLRRSSAAPARSQVQQGAAPGESTPPTRSSQRPERSRCPDRSTP